MLPILIHNQGLCKSYGINGIYNLENWNYVDIDIENKLKMNPI